MATLYYLPLLTLLQILVVGRSNPPEGVEPAFPNLSFTRPVDLQHAGDGTNRLFVVEQRGRIYVFENDESVTEKKLFLDIEERVLDRGNEQGLLGLAFHPNFSENGYLYVDYTANNPQRTVISRFTVDPSNSDQADPNTEHVLLEINQPFSNHNGGQVGFGPEGHLYIAMGDGGSAGDPMHHGQNRSSLLGAILRIDVDQATATRPYAIPEDNPFAGNAEGFREEIYAYGLRNPWRFSFDLESGTMWTGDVGQNEREEINIVTAGANYGWRTMEASLCFSPKSGCDRSNLELPVAEYGRREGISVTGGFVYRGNRIPALQGHYIYADFGTTNIWTLPTSGTSPGNPQLLMKSNLKIASFGIDQHQNLYLCAFDGTIYRFSLTE